MADRLLEILRDAVRHVRGVVRRVDRRATDAVAEFGEVRRDVRRVLEGAWDSKHVFTPAATCMCHVANQ